MENNRITVLSCEIPGRLDPHSMGAAIKSAFMWRYLPHHVTPGTRIKPPVDTFVRAYIEAALWSTNDESDEQGGNPMDANYGASDIALPSLWSMIDDCRRFRDTVMTAGGITATELIPDDSQGGHDFWLTRNRLGVGFWDRTRIYGKAPAEHLSNLARDFGEVALYIGDDGEIHAS